MAAYAIDKEQWGGAEGFDALLADIRARRDEFGRQKFISKDVIDRFKKIGVYRALVPKRYGGDEKSPIEFLLMVEAIAAADGSSGWVASFGMNPAYLCALPPTTVDKVWADGPDVVFGAGIFPPQPVKKVDGGYLVSGRWHFASGCMGADLLAVGIIPDDPQPLPRLAVFPANALTIEPNWDVIGMVGTGSHDLVLDNAVVPEEWTFVRGGKPTVDAPFFRYPSIAFAAQVLAITTAGLAREALDVVQGTAATRRSVTGAPNIGDRVYAQIDVAKAEAKLRSSRAFFYEAAEEAWAEVVAGGRPSDHQVSMLRLSASNLTHECAEAVRMVYQLLGMTSTYEAHPLSRIFRDTAMCTQHAFMGTITYQNAGAMMFGKQPLPGYL